MRLCRFTSSGHGPRLGLMRDNSSSLLDLSSAGAPGLTEVLEQSSPARFIESLMPAARELSLGNVRLLPPVEGQEVWAAGVTYLRSKKARMEESDFSATAYDKVYEAARPEIFFKSLPEKVVGPGESVGIRADALWSVPEPELALVMNSRGRIVGCTIGNDMSSRDIEGENLLYLPQAKIYRNSCSLGPCVRLLEAESEPRAWDVQIEVRRQQEQVFYGSASFSQMKRGFAELGEYLFRSQTFPRGAILLTGTSIVPPDGFTLRAGDLVSIHVEQIGTLENTVVVV